MGWRPLRQLNPRLWMSHNTRNSVRPYLNLGSLVVAVLAIANGGEPPAPPVGVPGMVASVPGSTSAASAVHSNLISQFFQEVGLGTCSAIGDVADMCAALIALVHGNHSGGNHPDLQGGDDPEMGV
eukprot:gb/GEZJ01007049.1/.p2 GENE.gb/GEZJ01007049.1/~~gb/GEZJ01007049.1/.p2  ORF type:complete len:126 (-),score=11.76 gb/GEZJ01007049.1/:534-911(-)